MNSLLSQLRTAHKTTPVISAAVAEKLVAIGLLNDMRLVYLAAGFPAGVVCRPLAPFLRMFVEVTSNNAATSHQSYEAVRVVIQDFILPLANPLMDDVSRAAISFQMTGSLEEGLPDSVFDAILLRACVAR